jgi:hypothetical protein
MARRCLEGKQGGSGAHYLSFDWYGSEFAAPAHGGIVDRRRAGRRGLPILLAKAAAETRDAKPIISSDFHLKAGVSPDSDGFGATSAAFLFIAGGEVFT